MAAKSMILMFIGVFCTLVPMRVVLFAGLLILQTGGLTVNGQGADRDGALFLYQKELEVKWIAENAFSNDRDCGSLASCSAECSRATCHPLSGELLQCISLHNSEFHDSCPSEGGCQNMLVDYSKSFVTLPGGASATSLQTEIARDICLQRRLDSTFKTVSDPLMYSEAYFGSASGAFRSFPGREHSDNLWASFDPRRRAWYLDGISVSRDVKILVDVAKSMDQVLTDGYKRPPGTTYLDVAKNMTLALLETFSPFDHAEVLSFNSTNATSLGGAFAVHSPYDDFFNPGLAPLVTNVKALAASSVAGASDLNGAISRAASSFNQIQSLKVIVVLSNGLFVVNSTTFPSAALQNYRAKLMVYKLPTNDDGGDIFLQSTPFQKDICSVQGSFELLDALATLNPLYSMRSYFTYLARIQLGAAGGSVTWQGQITNAFSSTSSDVASITYPVFGRDGLLIGVAGVDIVLDELGAPQKDLVLQKLLWRSRGPRSAPANIPMTCNYTTNIRPANWSCPPPDSSGICRQSVNSSTFAQRTCCETCVSRSEKEMRKIGLIILMALLAYLLVIITTVLWCCKRRILTSFVPQRVRQPVEGGDLYLNLCESIVDILDKYKSTRNLLNERQCLDLSSKLSRTIGNIREIIFRCGASANLFNPALEKLYLDLEKAELLMFQCGKEDWCRAAVFQIHNEMAFQEILLDVGLCYNAIYEQARSLGLEERNLPEDLRQSSAFMPTPKSDVHKDQVKLKKRLEVLASGHRVSGRVSLKPYLARYLVERLNYSSDANTLDTCSTFLWANEIEPTRIWGNSQFIGSGSGASGVCKTKWMGIPCAKKDFHVGDSEQFKQFFLKEASISAHIKHPCVVDFICCGNGTLKGERFIAMELMEKSLYDLIDGQGDEYFSLPVVVDIMVQIARGMCYLHGQGVAHRDLKPQNVVVNTLAYNLIDENYYYVKLVDFGMSKSKVEVLKSNSISFPGVGTTRYRAPEVHREAHPDGEGRANWFKADVFSFAMTCAHMLTLTTPFKDIDIQMNKIYAYLKDGNRPMLPSDCPQELKSLLEDCWTTNPHPRPTFVEILTRLEAFRFKILRGYPTYQPNLQGRSDEYIEVKIIEYNNTFCQRQSNANHGVVPERTTTNEIEEIEDMMVVSNPSTQGEIAPHISIEMTQRNSQHFRSFSL